MVWTVRLRRHADYTQLCIRWLHSIPMMAASQEMGREFRGNAGGANS